MKNEGHYRMQLRTLSVLCLSFLFLSFTVTEANAQRRIHLPGRTTPRPADEKPAKTPKTPKTKREPMLAINLSTFQTQFMQNVISTDSTMYNKGLQLQFTAYFFNGKNYQIGFGAGACSQKGSSMYTYMKSLLLPFYTSFRINPGRFYLRGDLGYSFTASVQQKAKNPYPGFNPGYKYVNDGFNKNYPFLRFTVGFELIPKELCAELGYQYSPTRYFSLYPDKVRPDLFTFGLALNLH